MEKIDLLDTSDEYIYRYIRDFPDVVNFMIESTNLARKSHNAEWIYQPRPDKDYKFTLKPFNDINSLKIYENEDKIKEYLGNDNYAVLKFSMKMCIYKLKMIRMFSTLKLHKNSSEPNLASFQQYSVTGDSVLEEEFDKKVSLYGSCFLFHGSNAENWYSIIRNGLKVMSNTRMMLNGAAYGNGIYLSDDLNFSQGYSRSSSSNIIIGVFEIIGERKDYYKNKSIYVVTDEKKVRLKYLICYNNDITQSIDLAGMLNEKFSNQIKTQIQNKKANISNIKHRRIMKEYSDIQKNKEYYENELGFSVTASETDITLWLISIKKVPSKELEESMKQLKITEILVEIRFSEQYPIQPPFVRILSPSFEQRTGHITAGGSICMEILYGNKGGWNPAVSVETLVMNIIATITNGDARILASSNPNYTLENAKNSYIQAGKTHGWV